MQDVTDYGAVGDGITDDTAAIQAAIDAAKVAGDASVPGGTVFFPSGEYSISAPLILPRNGATPQHVVWMQGENLRSVRLKGASSFPQDRGMIEWEATTERVWHGHISNMTFLLPNVQGVRGIWHKRNDPTVYVSSEWMQLNLDNLLFEGSNVYHEAFIDLDVGVRLSTLRNIFGDPGQGANPVYDTILIRTADGDAGNKYNDYEGIQFSSLTNIVPMLRRGGYSRAFSGRIFRSTWDTGVCNGAREPDDNPCYRFVNSVGCQLTNLSNEGRGESAQFYFDNCEMFTLENCGLGTPNENGGDGVVMENCRNMRWTGRFTAEGSPVFSELSTQVIRMDAKCENNVFENFDIRTAVAGNATTEITDGGTRNRVQGYTLTGGAGATVRTPYVVRVLSW